MTDAHLLFHGPVCAEAQLCRALWAVKLVACLLNGPACTACGLCGPHSLSGITQQGWHSSTNSMLFDGSSAPLLGCKPCSAAQVAPPACLAGGLLTCADVCGAVATPHVRMRRKAVKALVSHTEESLQHLKDDADEMLRGES